MARPRQIDTEDILAGARRCFLEHGAGVSTTEIARSIGISQAVLFQRFGTKEALLLAALECDGPAWLDLVEPGPDGRPVREQLHEIADGITAFSKKLVPRMSVLRSSGIDPHKLMKRHEVPPPVRAHQVLSGWFERAVDQGLLPDTDPALAASVFMGSVHGRIFLAHVAGRDAPVDGASVHDVVDLLCRGLAGKGL